MWWRNLRPVCRSSRQRSEPPRPVTPRTEQPEPETPPPRKKNEGDSKKKSANFLVLWSLILFFCEISYREINLHDFPWKTLTFVVLIKRHLLRSCLICHFLKITVRMAINIKPCLVRPSAASPSPRPDSSEGFKIAGGHHSRGQPSSVPKPEVAKEKIASRTRITSYDSASAFLINPPTTSAPALAVSSPSPPPTAQQPVAASNRYLRPPRLLFSKPKSGLWSSLRGPFSRARHYNMWFSCLAILTKLKYIWYIKYWCSYLLGFL